MTYTQRQLDTLKEDAQRLIDLINTQDFEKIKACIDDLETVATDKDFE